jgi:hypothetical protein
MADKEYTLSVATRPVNASSVRGVAVDLRDHGVPITAKAVAEKLGCEAADAERILDTFVAGNKMSAVDAVLPKDGNA